MSKAILYVHGKGGNGSEADRLIPILKDYDVFGIDFEDFTPWGTQEPLRNTFRALSEKYETVSVIANSIGAYFTMLSLSGYPVEKAFFISPVLDMEKLITDMMQWAGVTEDELKDKKEIPTDFGETLSWDYLTFVRSNPIEWSVQTEILYAGKDNLISRETVEKFIGTHNAGLTVTENGEHRFHTEEQLRFLDNCLINTFGGNIMENKICQSCGMPIVSDDQWGTDKDGSISKDYCRYCYVDGEFIDKVTMEEYIEMCSQYGAQAGMINEEMKAHCQKLFPTLKRWKKQ